ncbi:MAG: insulinase family protein [Acidobacteria bacterium]|nr:MAG: insulinase family protein [Acidobacteriota bacterium]
MIRRPACPLVVLSLLVAAGCGGSERMDDMVLLPVPEDPTVSFDLWFAVGSLDDPPGKEGLAYVTGQLLAQGATANNSYEEILEKLYPLAASYDVRVDKEMTTLTGRVHRDKLDEYLPLLVDAFLRPAFREDDFERVRSDALNYVRNTLRYASDEELGKAALWLDVFEGTGYAHPVQGTVAGLEAISLDDVKRFYAEHFTRDNLVIGVGGGYDDAVVERLREARASLPAGRPAARPAPEPRPLEGRRVLLVSKPGADASISFGFPIDVRRGDPDFYALWVANSWLGEHRNSSSHLYQVIREARGLNYGDYSYIEAFPEGGQRTMPPTNVGRRQQLFEVWIRTLPNEQAHFALRAAVRELAHLVDHGLTEEQFELTRSFLSKYVLHFADTTAARLGYAIDDRFYGIEGSHLENFRRRLADLTLEEVNAAIRRHLQYRNLDIAIVTGDAERLAEALASDAPSPISYAAPKPPEILAEDEEIATYPLKIPRDRIRIVPVTEIFER